MVFIFLCILILILVVLALVFLQGMASVKTSSEPPTGTSGQSGEVMPGLVSKITLPLGNKYKDVVCVRGSSRRLLIFLQCNMMNPTADYAEFTKHGWTVFACGYTNTLIGTARHVVRAIDKFAGDGSAFGEIGVWARSIGTCFAPEVCLSAMCRDRIRWAAYITPLASVGELVRLPGTHLFVEGASLGFRRAQDAVPHHVLGASEDEVTPFEPVQRMIDAGGVPRPSSVRVALGYGHNNITLSSERYHLIRELLKA